MAYLGDIRENSISPEGIIWESDNRKDTRYYWNGAFIDFCDLPPEDYAKTIFVTVGTNSEPSTPTKQKNPIKIQETEYMNENGEIFYAYKAVATQAVTSEVTIEMSVSDQFGATEKITIKIPAGANESDVVTTSTYTEGFERPTINTSNYSPKEDDTFKYNKILHEAPITLPKAYSITMLSGKIETISDEELIEKLIASGQIAMKDAVTSEKFTVDFTPIPVDGLETMGVIELTDALINNASDIILVTDKAIKSIEQADVAGINEIALWTKRNGNVQINGKPYDVWYKRDEGQTSQSKICDSVNAGYVVGADPRDYIIYYE